MGMFDSFYFEQDNQFKLPAGEYQTKELDCSLHEFTADKDNLIHGEPGDSDYPLDELNAINDGTFTTKSIGFDHDELFGCYEITIVNSRIVLIEFSGNVYYTKNFGVAHGYEYGNALYDAIGNLCC